MTKNKFNSIKIMPVNASTEKSAEKLIIEGLGEYFDHYEASKNPDLNGILQNYHQSGDVFFVGLYNGQVVATGALIEEAEDVGRIVRMSVARAYRRMGIAKIVLQALETRAWDKGYKKIVLETTKTWTGAIDFYKNCGYQVDRVDEEDIHFVKVRDNRLLLGD